MAACGQWCSPETYRKAKEGLFRKAFGDRTRSNSFKLEQGRLRLEIRREFFTTRMLKYNEVVQRFG